MRQCRMQLLRPEWLARIQRPGLTVQLFLAVLATATLVTVAMGTATQWTFHRGFIGYLNQQAVVRMEAALPRVQAAYAQHGNWSFVHDRPDVWFGLVGVERIVSPQAARGQEGRAMFDSDLLGAGRRMSLLDSQRQHVMGFPFIMADSVQREIVVDGQTVGWLVIAPIQGVTDTAAMRFADEQWRTSLAAGVLGVAMAALIAWWAARKLLAPVRTVAEATHRVAAGSYETRVAVGSDDEVGQLARDFNHLAHKLEANERMRRNFMADVSHELRTPLAVLRGELEALEDGVRQPTPETLSALLGEVATLTQLVDDLYDLALSDVGALSYRKEAIDIVDLVDAEAQLMRRSAAERQLRLTQTLAAEPVWVMADASRVRQLLHNVLINAMRYTDAGGEIALHVHREGDTVHIDVMDTPPGVPDDMLPQLFDRFFRVEGSRSRASGGSGLGLAICRNIVEAHEGRISARHAPQGGLWVAIELPVLPTGATRTGAVNHG